MTNALSGQPSNIVKIILGEVTVIRTSDFVSIARLKKLAEPEGLPVMNYYQFMLEQADKSYDYIIEVIKRY